MPIIVPMAGHYRRDQTFEARRAKFYSQMHMVYGLCGWKQPKPVKAIVAKPGFDGNEPVLRRIDQKTAVDININSAPFEWLRQTRRLSSREDAPGSEMARVAAGEEFRSVVEGASVSLVRSVDWSAVSSSGFGPKSPTDHKFDCMKKAQRWRDLMGGHGLFELLESVIVYDRFDAILDKDRKIVPNAIESVRVALDIIALDLSLITARAFRARWSFLPSVSRSPQVRRFS